ncbi:hypothetical protein TELCIR_21486, partial [Teladorsagia circumcincta]
KSSPSFTELEMKTLDWLVDLLGLPTYFKVEEEDPAVITSPYHDPIVFRRLIAYFTDQAHYSVEKVAAFCGVKFRKLRTILDPILKNYSVTKETLETAIR